MPRISVVIFHTIHDLFALKRALARHGVEARPVPTPRELSSDCGSVLAFSPEQAETVRRVAAEEQLEVQGIHELDG